MVAPAQHRIRLHSPFYADPGDGTLIHRYMEDQFIPRFIQEAGNGRLTGTAHQAWRSKDRFGRHKDLPMLRLPLHRTFYVACCEASCHMPGTPALDPARIVSAAIVIRRRADGAGTGRWMLRDGEPWGWQDGEVPSYEPNEYRRLVARRLIRRRFPDPPPSGEETYPLHPLAVTSRVSGRTRSHTLLFGYLPLGGSYRVAQDNPPATAEGSRPLDYRAEHLWPFGIRSSPRETWAQPHGLAVYNGVASQAFHGLLGTLLGRYRVQDAGLADNEALRNLLAQIWFYNPAPSLDGGADDPVLNRKHRVRTLRTYLDGRAEQVLEWLSLIQRGDQPASYALPSFAGATSPGKQADLTRLDDTLYVTRDHAEGVRELLAVRAEKAVAAIEDGLPIPRFTPGDGDVYFARPFLRYLDAKGCERVAWGPDSGPFRVAAPLDPEAVRPQLIPLPDLSDIKRGVAKGVTLLAPKSLADKLRSITMDKEVEKSTDKGNPLDACFSFSFSLPIVTLCAMILLMIIINLLNIIFFWLPYAFLALPRLCLKLMTRGNNP